MTMTADDIDLWARCTICGADVADRKKHVEWHNSLQPARVSAEDQRCDPDGKYLYRVTFEAWLDRGDLGACFHHGGEGVVRGSINYERLPS